MLLRRQLGKILTADAGPISELTQWWDETSPRTTYQAEVHDGVSAQGTGAMARGRVAVRRDVLGNLLMSNVDAEPSGMHSDEGGGRGYGSAPKQAPVGAGTVRADDEDIENFLDTSAVVPEKPA